MRGLEFIAKLQQEHSWFISDEEDHCLRLQQGEKLLYANRQGLELDECAIPDIGEIKPTRDSLLGVIDLIIDFDWEQY